ncbi:MAG: aminotransferase class V-fold PLP-dependent enzyme [Gemmatimonadetes bacterium]|nr:aminotransferase class V-fold PLP-dependent enzyme [Gemmatimonadota bacterium]
MNKEMEIERLRLETPGCSERIHLNNAGASLMPKPVIDAIKDQLDLESSIGGYEAAAEREQEIKAAYDAVASLVGTNSRNVAFTENATISYIQALSSIRFETGDVILTTRNDYASNQIQFLSLQARFGVKVVRAPDLAEGGVDVAAMSDLIDGERPKLVCVTHVPTSSGLIQDITAIGALCRAAEIIYLVDGSQSLGQMPIDVEKIGCDFFSATSRKFLRGPRGAGFLCVSDGVLESDLEPLFIDMRGADWVGGERYERRGDARRFESWEFAWSLVLGTGAAARYAASVGLDQIETRVSDLGKTLRGRLEGLDGVRVLDRGSDLCAIVTVWVDGWEPIQLVQELRKRKINTSAQVRSDAVLHYDESGATGALRISPHYYNTEEEIETVFEAVTELVALKK